MSTSIAIIRTEQCVVMAADSAVVDELGNRIGLQCKIRPIGKFVYVANKFTLDSAELRKAIPEPLVRALAGSRQRNPGRLRENFRSAQVLGVTVAAVENGRPSLVDLRFRMNDMEAEDIQLTIEEHLCPGPRLPNRSSYDSRRPNIFTRRLRKRVPKVLDWKPG